MGIRHLGGKRYYHHMVILLSVFRALSLGLQRVVGFFSPFSPLFRRYRKLRGDSCCLFSSPKSDKVLVKLFLFQGDFYYRDRKLWASFKMVTYPLSLT